MNDSILRTVKMCCGVPEWDDGFDQELITHINSVLMTVSQIGVGQPRGMFITGMNDTWASLLSGSKDYEAIRSYVVLKTRLLFDPPTNSSILESYKNQIAEFEWRLNVQSEEAIYYD